MRYRARHIVEYAFLRVLAALVGLLPRSMAVRLALSISAFSFNVLKFRVTEAESRIRQVLGENTDPGEVRRIARRACDNFMVNVVEMLRISARPEAFAKTDFPFEDLKAKLHRLPAEGGAIMVGIHIGSWELPVPAFQAIDLNICYFFRPQKNPLVNRYMEEVRERSQATGVASDSADMRRIVKHLKAGNILATLIDLRARTQSVQVDYLGHRADLGRGVPLFARLADVPVQPFFLLRSGWNQFDIRTFDLIRPDPQLDRDQDCERMMQAIADLATNLVKEYPDQYLWYNKRWVLDPLSSDDTAEPDPAG